MKWGDAQQNELIEKKEYRNLQLSTSFIKYTGSPTLWAREKMRATQITMLLHCRKEMKVNEQTRLRTQERFFSSLSNSACNEEEWKVLLTQVNLDVRIWFYGFTLSSEYKYLPFVKFTVLCLSILIHLWLCADYLLFLKKVFVARWTVTLTSYLLFLLIRNCYSASVCCR